MKVDNGTVHAIVYDVTNLTTFIVIVAALYSVKPIFGLVYAAAAVVKLISGFLYQSYARAKEKQLLNNLLGELKEQELYSNKNDPSQFN